MFNRNNWGKEGKTLLGKKNSQQSRDKGVRGSRSSKIENRQFLPKRREGLENRGGLRLLALIGEEWID